MQDIRRRLCTALRVRLVSSRGGSVQKLIFMIHFGYQPTVHLSHFPSLFSTGSVLQTVKRSDLQNTQREGYSGGLQCVTGDQSTPAAMGYLPYFSVAVSTARILLKGILHGIQQRGQIINLP